MEALLVQAKEKFEEREKAAAAERATLSALEVELSGVKEEITALANEEARVRQRLRRQHVCTRTNLLTSQHGPFHRCETSSTTQSRYNQHACGSPSAPCHLAVQWRRSQAAQSASQQRHSCVQSKLHSATG